MRAIGVDPALVPARKSGIGADRSYDAQRDAAAAAASVTPQAVSVVDSCCCAPADSDAGFNGTAGIAAANASFTPAIDVARVSAENIPEVAEIDALLLDIEG